MIRDYFDYGVRNLKYRKLRSLLTIVGIVIGIAAIVSLIELGEGMQNAINEQFEKLGINSIRVVPKGFRGPQGGLDGLTESDVKAVERIPGVDYAESIYFHRGKVQYGNEYYHATVTGTPLSKSEKVVADLDLDFESGRRFEGGEKDAVMLGYNVAHGKFKKDIKIRNSIEVDGKKFKVVGIVEKTGAVDDNIYMPLESVRELAGNKDGVSAIRVQMLEGQDMGAIARSIENRLKRTKDEGSFQVFTPKQLLDQIGSILSIIQIILAGIAAISLLVGGIGIMNSMYTSVKERTRDIGVMKAIGATNGKIASLFLIESGMMGMLGGAIGVVLGIGMAFSVEGIARRLGFGLISIHIDLWLLLFALAFAFVVGVLSGLFPAIKASRMYPVEALRYE